LNLLESGSELHSSLCSFFELHWCFLRRKNDRRTTMHINNNRT
jgi:hypothetical protein